MLALLRNALDWFLGFLAWEFFPQELCPRCNSLKSPALVMHDKKHNHWRCEDCLLEWRTERDR